MTAFDDSRAAAGMPDPRSWAIGTPDDEMPAMVDGALAEGRCSLSFQPVFRVDGGIAFHEGLIRLTDPHGRPLPAREVLRAVEETGTGRDLDVAALRLGLVMLRQHPGLRLSLDVSARSLADGVWREALQAELAAGADAFAGERLILEISERSAMLLPEVVARFMDEIQPAGLAFALDGFGCGCTSFRHLRGFLFDMVKIDRGFVHRVADDADNQVLVGALVAVARQFDMFTVATGVERRADAEWLVGAGLDCLQGVHLGMPRVRL